MQAAADIEQWVDERLVVLTTDEKISLVAGADAWRTAAVERVAPLIVITTSGPASIRSPNGGKSVARFTGTTRPRRRREVPSRNLATARDQASKRAGCDRPATSDTMGG